MVGGADRLPTSRRSSCSGVATLAPLTALAALGLLAPPSCEQQRALVTLDVSGDAAFPSVTLRLVANGTTTKVFPGASFSPTQAFRVGLYLPAGLGPIVTIVATAQEGSCLVGNGQVTIPGVAAGAATAPVSLLVAQMTCVPVPVDAGVDTTPAMGTGGAGGGGPGGSAGTGGVGSGQGGGPGGTPGSGGATGTGGTIGGTGGTIGGTGGGQTAGNLILNGDFSGGDTLWQFTDDSPITTTTYGVMNGAYCVDLVPGNSVSIGWPSDLSLALKLLSGTYYQFSYQVSASAVGTGLEAKIGKAVTPYGADFDETTDMPTATPQTFQHLFKTAVVDAAYADSEGGVVFNVTALGSGDSTFCLDNVTLVQAN
jgi:hypothetical protein